VTPTTERLLLYVAWALGGSIVLVTVLFVARLA
jgi:hypothetical protein